MAPLTAMEEFIEQITPLAPIDQLIQARQADENYYIDLFKSKEFDQLEKLPKNEGIRVTSIKIDRPMYQLKLLNSVDGENFGLVYTYPEIKLRQYIWSILWDKIRGEDINVTINRLSPWEMVDKTKEAPRIITVLAIEDFKKKALKASDLKVEVFFEENPKSMVPTELSLTALDPGEYTLHIDTDGKASLEKIGWISWLVS